MEKTIFLFWRHRNRSKADFARHYIQQHAPLGARLTRTLLGYTVNIVEGDAGPDAITEHWLADAMDLLTPDRAYATREDFEAVVADDRTLFRELVLHVAVRETQPVPGEPSGAAPGQPTPGTKMIWLYPDASKAPPPPQARRVVDSHIGYKLVFEDGARKKVKPDFELIRMAWLADRVGSDSSSTDPIITREYPFIREPTWGLRMQDDMEEIKKLKARYFRSLDSKDWQIYRSVFADDVVVDLRRAGGERYEGIDKFVAYAKSLKIVQSVHHGHMPEIDLTSATTATGVWSMEDYNIWEDGSQNHGWGHYLETYVKRDSRWQIKTMQLSYLRVERSFGTPPMIAGVDKVGHLRGERPAGTSDTP